MKTADSIKISQLNFFILSQWFYVLEQIPIRGTGCVFKPSALKRNDKRARRGCVKRYVNRDSRMIACFKGLKQMAASLSLSQKQKQKDNPLQSSEEIKVRVHSYRHIVIIIAGNFNLQKVIIFYFFPPF